MKKSRRVIDFEWICVLPMGDLLMIKSNLTIVSLLAHGKSLFHTVVIGCETAKRSINKVESNE